MKTLITGGNGFLGHHLISELRQRGDTVRALVLPGERATWLEERSVPVYRGNVCEPDTLVEPMRGVDAVFHLAAAHGLWRALHDYHSVNVVGTENVCRAALEASVRRVVHISSWTVYGMGMHYPVTEDHPLRPIPDRYTITKAQGERIVQGFVASDRLPAVIIRPGTMFGPGDYVNFGRMADRLRDGRAIVFGSGRNVLPFVYVSDVVRGLILSVDSDQAVGQVYNITHDQPITQGEMWRAIAEEIGARPPLVHVPYHALYALGFVAEQWAMFTRVQKQPILTRLGVQLFGTNNQHTIVKARRELGYVPQVSIRAGVHLASMWYREVNFSKASQQHLSTSVTRQEQQ